MRPRGIIVLVKSRARGIIVLVKSNQLVKKKIETKHLSLVKAIVLVLKARAFRYK